MTATEGPLLTETTCTTEGPLLTETAPPSRCSFRSIKNNVARTLRTFGPGLMVCLADTDGACLLTAAQSGAEYKYSLFLAQVILIPILYAAQELTIRLALYKKAGIVGVVRQEFGRVAAWVVTVPLVLSCIAATVSEVSSVSSAMAVCGVPLWVTSVVCSLFLGLLALSGSYSLAEKLGLTFGSLQVTFLVLVFVAGPSLVELGKGLITFPAREPEFDKLVTSNIGAVIMPWMLAYQQAAVAQGGHTPEKLAEMRFETKFGSVVTQAVMIAVLVMAAATVPGTQLETVDDLAGIVRKVVGNDTLGNIVTMMSVCGASLVAAIVVMLCAAWTLEEAITGAVRGAGEPEAGWSGMVNRVRDRPSFYMVCIVSMLIAFFFTVNTSEDSETIVQLSVGVQFINGLLMPPIVFALWYLCAFRLPECPLQGARRNVIGFAFLVCSVFCLVSAILGA